MVPFRMQPGLDRLRDDPLGPVPAEPAGRAAVARAVALRRLPLLLDDPVVPDALRAACAALGVRIEHGDDPWRVALLLREAIADDFVLMTAAAGPDEAAADSLRAACMAVAMPTHWRPEDKLGLDIRTIHQPVADRALLDRSWPALVRRLIRGPSLRRHVWTIADGAELSLHPDDPRVPRGIAADGNAWFRVERQTLVPLPAQRACLFLIRVWVAPLSAVLAVAPERPAMLRASLESMSDAVVRYKGLGTMRERLLNELAAADGVSR